MRHAEFLFFITTSHPTSEYHNPYNLYKFAAVTTTHLRLVGQRARKEAVWKRKTENDFVQNYIFDRFFFAF